MKILVTGAKGFIGRNLVWELKNYGYNEIIEYDVDTNPDLLEKFILKSDFIFHLAGVNRPKNEDEFMKGNFGLLSEVLTILNKNSRSTPIMLSSSIQAELSNEYGKSKKASEELLFEYEKRTGAKVFIYRFSNIFGKWSKPNYNSVIATFSYNISRRIPIKINDPEVELRLIYIDDVVSSLRKLLNQEKYSSGKIYYIDKEYTSKLSEIVTLLYSFRDSRDNLLVPDTKNTFVKKLYSTYLSYIPIEELVYNLKMNNDNRGSFTEFIKSNDRGQVSINVSKPGIIKGNHWHKTKNEKFLVVSGTAKIKLMNLHTEEIVSYTLSDTEFQVIDIPPGYVHNIVNIGKENLVTVMWANEQFNLQNPDTYYIEF